ncbi:MAG: tetratricopeptide repeat protein [Gemmatimonadota bacterium]|nr:tetratricopeptide repeat protein [Gemmatimonadota bacterium]
MKRCRVGITLGCALVVSTAGAAGQTLPERADAGLEMGTLVILSGSAAEALLVDPTRNRIVARFRTGPDPREVALSPDGRFAYVSSYGWKPQSGAEARPRSSGEPGEGPRAVAAPADASPATRGLTVLDLARRRVHAVFQPGTYLNLGSVTVGPAGRRLWVTTEGEVSLLAGTGTIGEVDGSADQAQFSWPNGIAAAPTGDRFYVNDYLNRTPPTATRRPVPRSSLRMVKLASISQRRVAALRSSGIDAMEEAYREFKEAPGTSGVFTEPEVNALGYQLMSSGRLDAATRVFELNVESYPDSWNVYDSLAEAHMRAGDDERAIELYERSLEINPGNTNATEMIERIRSGE